MLAGDSSSLLDDFRVLGRDDQKNWIEFVAEPHGELG
jgi:hypothetical protein